MFKMKQVYIIATPSGRSIISIKDDPRKAFHKTVLKARREMRNIQKNYKVKLKVKILMIPNKTYNQHY